MVLLNYLPYSFSKKLIKNNSKYQLNFDNFFRTSIFRHYILQLWLWDVWPAYKGWRLRIALFYTCQFAVKFAYVCLSG